MATPVVEAKALLESRRCVPLSTLILLEILVICIDLPLNIWFAWQHGSILVQCLLKGLACLLLGAQGIRRWNQHSSRQPPVFSAYSLSHWLQLAFCSLYLASGIVFLIQDSLHPLGRDGHTLAALSVMLTPLLLGVIFADALRGFVVVLWAAALLSLVMAAVLTSSAAYGAAVGYYFLQSALIFYAMRQSNLKAQVVEQKGAAALGAADSNMKAILGNVAHDLKTPLASFMAGVQVVGDLVEEAKALAPAARDVLSSAQQCLQHVNTTNNFMLMTINRCLDYTKTSQGLKLVPHFETVPLHAVMSMPMVCMKNIQQRVSFEMEDFPEEIAHAIITDKLWLQENLLCLLSNAVKYSADGTVTVSVCLVDSTASTDDLDEPAALPVNHKSKPKIHKVSPETASFSTADSSGKSQHIRIQVEDCGIGMSEKAMEALFSPFRQNQRLAGGTGLGLFSLAKRMESLQGACGVSKRQDGKQGSLFWFSFPYRPDELHFADIGINSSQSPTNTTRKSIRIGVEEKKRVLLVDDSPFIIKMTTMQLNKLGFAVSIAENGVMALDLLQREGAKYDIVLMDLQMPVMDGLEAMKRLRQHEASNALPQQLVFGLSANSDLDVLEEVKHCGFDGFLPKPFDQQSFLNLFQQHQV